VFFFSYKQENKQNMTTKCYVKKLL